MREQSCSGLLWLCRTLVPTVYLYPQFLKVLIADQDLAAKGPVKMQNKRAVAAVKNLKLKER